MCQPDGYHREVHVSENITEADVMAGKIGLEPEIIEGIEEESPEDKISIIIPRAASMVVPGNVTVEPNGVPEDVAEVQAEEEIDETLVEYWQGHSLGKVRGAYFIPPVQEQLRLYKLAEQRLEPTIKEEKHS